MCRDSRASGALVAVVAAAALALGGCGAGTTLFQGSSRPREATSSRAVSAAAVAVIKGWSDALRAGRVTAAAAYFHLPSVFFTGSGPPLELRTLKQAETANAALPCGARFISAHLQGPYVNVLFRLTDRTGPGGGGGCGTGSGQTARTDFLIRAGHIVQWLRAPDEPGDNGSPRTPSASPAPSLV
jgi:hypothetical protein